MPGMKNQIGKTTCPEIYNQFTYILANNTSCTISINYYLFLLYVISWKDSQNAKSMIENFNDLNNTITYFHCLFFFLSDECIDRFYMLDNVPPVLGELLLVEKFFSTYLHFQV